MIKEFCDKFNISHVFKPGEVLDFIEERAKDLIARGIVKAETKAEAAPTEQATVSADAKAESEAKAEEIIKKARKRSKQ